MKLSDVVPILDEQKFSDADKHITTTGGKLKATRSKIKSSFALSGPSFLTSLLTRWLPYTVVYLKTLMYGYVVCSLKDNPENPRFALNAVLECVDTFEALVVKDCNMGGAAKGLILQADLVLRAELFRLNDRPTTYPYYTRVTYQVGGGAVTVGVAHP